MPRTDLVSSKNVLDAQGLVVNATVPSASFSKNSIDLTAVVVSRGNSGYLESGYGVTTDFGLHLAGVGAHGLDLHSARAGVHGLTLHSVGVGAHGLEGSCTVIPDSSYASGSKLPPNQVAGVGIASSPHVSFKVVDSNLISKSGLTTLVPKNKGAVSDSLPINQNLGSPSFAQVLNSQDLSSSIKMADSHASLIAPETCKPIIKGNYVCVKPITKSTIVTDVPVKNAFSALKKDLVVETPMDEGESHGNKKTWADKVDAPIADIPLVNTKEDATLAQDCIPSSAAATTAILNNEEQILPQHTNLL
ncbi:hypothetical protein TorRG33x02_130670 [Trema orientale]|uniref:Uncharacterized protein n=1 Tax=Trema orientale TaxID=63057 RepID=A0A2P5EZS3_TREOI|nr:hypothetical protein TorRG33x02_130670 [Trema orientale]